MSRVGRGEGQSKEASRFFLNELHEYLHRFYLVSS